MQHKQRSDIFYTTLQRRLHWLAILLITGQYLLQDAMRAAMDTIEIGQTLGFTEFLVTSLHSWSGISIAALMLWRWQLRKRVVPINAGQLSQRRARWVAIHHVSLYVVVVLMALTGAAYYYLEWPFAAELHRAGKWLLAGLILAHVLGALLHVREGNNVLRRMMGAGSLR